MRLWMMAAAALTAAVPATAQSVAERGAVCLGCHGAAAAKLPGVPYVGGQPNDYLLVQMLSFREGQRVAAPMNTLLKGVSDDDLQALAALLTGVAPPEATGAAEDTAALDHGGALVARYHCGSCHNPDFSGHDQIPRLADQREDYLVKSLTQYKTNDRIGYEPAMNEAAQEVAVGDIPILARYLAHYRVGDDRVRN